MLGILFGLIGVAIVVWYVRDRGREVRHQAEQSMSQESRRQTLEDAAEMVARQAELSRDVARRINEHPVEVPSNLRLAVNAVVMELDGVAADLRSCQVPIAVAARRTLVHR